MPGRGSPASQTCLVQILWDILKWPGEFWKTEDMFGGLLGLLWFLIVIQGKLLRKKTVLQCFLAFAPRPESSNMQEITSVVVLKLFCKRTKFVLTKKLACLCPWELLLRIPLFLFVVFYTVIGEPETAVHCQVDSLKQASTIITVRMDRGLVNCMSLAMEQVQQNNNGGYNGQTCTLWTNGYWSSHQCPKIKLSPVRRTPPVLELVKVSR